MALTLQQLIARKQEGGGSDAAAILALDLINKHYIIFLTHIGTLL